ncbi:MAG TPA: hypothetical protein VF037_00435 [Gemmatimonadales bacterium]
MPSDYEIDELQRLIRVTATGHLTDADFLEQRVRLRDDPAFDRDFSFLVDLRAVTEVSLSAQVVARLARDPISAPGVRRALVFPPAGPGSDEPEPHAFGLGRVFQTIAALRGEDVEVFMHLGDAERWLAGGRD